MSEYAITMKNVTKEFKVLNRREGLKGSFLDLFSRDYKVIRAVDNVSIDIEDSTVGIDPTELVGGGIEARTS